MVVREALPADFPAISRLFEEVDQLHSEAEPGVFQNPVPSGRSPQFLDRKLDALDVGMFVAEQAGEVVGFAIVRLSSAPDIPVLRPRRFAYLEDIVVAARVSRHGIGRALMRQVEAWAENQGADRVELTVWEFNRNAIDFYAALGYRTDYRWMSRSIKAG
jgi:ribosomal protein S18 acetylase RimI-like enzyme